MKHQQNVNQRGRQKRRSKKWQFASEVYHHMTTEMEKRNAEMLFGEVLSVWNVVKCTGARRNDISLYRQEENKNNKKKKKKKNSIGFDFALWAIPWYYNSLTSEWLNYYSMREREKRMLFTKNSFYYSYWIIHLFYKVKTLAIREITIVSLFFSCTFFTVMTPIRLIRKRKNDTPDDIWQAVF